jgi:hypothetical protein
MGNAGRVVIFTLPRSIQGGLEVFLYPRRLVSSMKCTYPILPPAACPKRQTATYYYTEDFVEFNYSDYFDI